MKVLVVGASGATGKHLVEQLLLAGHTIKIIVRPSGSVPDTWQKHNRIELIRAGIADMGISEMATCLQGCNSVASCLGHNLTRKGIFGKPRKLVTNAVKLICEAIAQNYPGQHIRFVLMNTAGNRNRDLNEPLSLGHRVVNSLIRTLVPPHSDNEQAAEHLRSLIGQNNENVEWVVVRPDTLIDNNEVTEYSVYPSPIRSALFNPGKTSRINVGHFMSRLLSEKELWRTWKGKMPVIYNLDEP